MILQHFIWLFVMSLMTFKAIVNSQQNTRNKEIDKAHNMNRLGKVSYWEKYGVIRFPYGGRRRYSPYAYQSVGGGIVISNDVFGLAIKQFDQIYKACLNRRKTHEQYILNLRYPDKASDEYLEYLQESTDKNQEMEKTVRISQRSSESPFAAKKRLRPSAHHRQQAYASGSQQSDEVIYQRVQQRDVPTQLENISNNVVGQHTSTQVSAQMTQELRKEVVETVNALIHSPAPDAVYERQQSNKDCVSWTGDDLNERYLCQHLINVAGSELEMRQRQQLFIVQDILYNAYRSNIHSRLTKISSGSLAEGIDLPGSDIDIMYVIEEIEVIRDVRNIKHPVQRTLLVMETDNDHPGFARLRLIPEVHIDSSFIPTRNIKCTTRKGSYLSTYQFICGIIKTMPHLKLSPHGPSLTDKDQCLDFVYCLRSKYLPYSAIQWTSRHQRQWPPESVIDKIKEYGCLFVPIGPRTLPGDCNVLWRISFSFAEKQLVHSFNYTQLLCYYLLKLTLKHIVNTNKDADGLLCSYFLKTALFWVSEEIDIETFQLSKLYFCFSHCLSKVILWVNNCFCPNYFIPEQNMFIGKIRPDNNKTLIDVLKKIQCEGIDGLERNLFQHSDRSLHTQREYYFIMVDLLFYRVALNSAAMVDLSQCLKNLEFIECLLKSKSPSFFFDVCKYYHAEISQYAAQFLPSPTVTTERYNIHKCYHRYLHDGLKTDVVSGWLLYASFYYVTGQFKVALRITNKVLFSLSPDMLPIGYTDYSDRLNYYRNIVHSKMTLHDKLRTAVVRFVTFVHNSSLIPNELQLEVKDHYICIPPNVMTHCLRYLCYHHLGDIKKRNQALLDLCATFTDNPHGNFISENTLSNSLTILGVCFEIFDKNDKDAVHQCYKTALQCDGLICDSAETRRLKLLTD